MPSQYSKLQANKFDAWKNAYMHLGSKAVTLNDLRLQGTSACVLQLIVTTTLPVVWYILFYSKDSRLTAIPILTWAITAFAGCLGVSGFVFLKSLLLGLHAVMALALGAALGVFHTELYMLMVDRCERAQVSFKGCAACACAAVNNCTRAALATGSCTDCRAWATDVCSGVNTAASALPYMGLMELFFIALPAVFSYMVLMRMEKEHSDAANKLLYARSVVNRELDRLEAKRGLDVDLVVFKQLLTSLQRYGNSKDRAAVASACELLGLDEELLAVEFDEEARGDAGHGPTGPSFKVGSVTMRHEDYLRSMAQHGGGGGGGFLNSSMTLAAPPATPLMPHGRHPPQQQPPMAMAAHQLQDPTRARAALPYDELGSPGAGGHTGHTPVEPADPRWGQQQYDEYDETDYYDEDGGEYGAYTDGGDWVTDVEGPDGAAAAGAAGPGGEAAPKKKKKKKKEGAVESEEGAVVKKKKKKKKSAAGADGGAEEEAGPDGPGGGTATDGEGVVSVKKKKKKKAAAAEGEGDGGVALKKKKKKNQVAPVDAGGYGEALPGGVVNDVDMGLVDAALEELEAGLSKEKKKGTKKAAGKKARKSDA